MPPLVTLRPPQAKHVSPPSHCPLENDPMDRFLKALVATLLVLYGLGFHNS